MNNFPKIIISGGGTGGHIFPAIAIADALRKISPNCEILFVGANGRMEMEKVPAAGYQIVGLNISGMQRGSILKNLLLPIKVVLSLFASWRILAKFKPDAVVGVGGYASGPLLFAASVVRIPYLIQEQNSFAGLTNKFLGKRAKRICVAFDGMESFFPIERILKTGNPVRRTSTDIEGKRLEAFKYFGLNPNKKTVLLTGGSLGAGTLNRSMEQHLELFIKEDVQLLWQTGKYYYQGIVTRLGDNLHPNIKVLEFLSRMDYAYAVADVVISRAGAGTIAELCLVAKPVILVPSPNVAEDHQTKNALALSQENAALLIADGAAEHSLAADAIALLQNNDKMKMLSKNIARMALPDADVLIAQEVLKLIKNK